MPGWVLLIQPNGFEVEQLAAWVAQGVMYMVLGRVRQTPRAVSPYHDIHSELPPSGALEMRQRSCRHICFTLILLVTQAGACSRNREPVTGAQVAKVQVGVNWDKLLSVSKTTATLQVVVNPPLRRGSKIHDRVFQALRDLGCDYVRYVPWLPYPKLGVAELDEPKGGKTSWDFSLIDPMMEDFISATMGHSVILNFSTIPQWMFKTDKPIAYPADPNQVMWDYEKGTEFRDPTLKEVADYYARLASWYTKGGFTDEYGKRHDSGHHFNVDYWEVLNEVDFEHQMTPETYTRVYDAIVAAIRRVQPQSRFVALALAAPSKAPHFFEYFLNRKNHKPGIPIDVISYHFYASPSPDETLQTKQFSFFGQADAFLDTVRYIETIRQRLAPETRTTVDETGSIDASDFEQDKPGYVFKGLPSAYWNLSGATYAYVYAGLAKQGIDITGESQLLGYPSQFPSVSMVDWETGQPNARYWVLKLIHENFGPGDKLVDTSTTVPYIHAQGFVTHSGKRKLMLINKRNSSFDVSIPGGGNADYSYVDQTTGFQPPVAHLHSEQMSLRGFAVVVVNWPGELPRQANVIRSSTVARDPARTVAIISNAGPVTGP